jgi:hypothetical protein
MSKFSKAPGKEAKPARDADDFIEAANRSPPGSESYPWIGQDDKRRRSGFNMRFTDAELAKLKFIAENTPFSMHEFCIRVISPAIDAKIAELTKQKS